MSYTLPLYIVSPNLTCPICKDELESETALKTHHCHKQPKSGAYKGFYLPSNLNNRDGNTMYYTCPHCNTVITKPFGVGTATITINNHLLSCPKYKQQ